MGEVTGRINKTEDSIYDRAPTRECMVCDELEDPKSSIISKSPWLCPRCKGILQKVIHEYDNKIAKYHIGQKVRITSNVEYIYSLLIHDYNSSEATYLAEKIVGMIGTIKNIHHIIRYGEETVSYTIDLDGALFTFPQESINNT